MLVLLTGLVVQGHWHDSWTHLIHPVVCQVLRGRHSTQISKASHPEGPGYDDPLSGLLASWLVEDKVYAKEWTPQLLAGLLATLPVAPMPSQEDARTPALWHAERLSLSPNSLSNEQDPRSRASVFALAAGPSFLSCLCDTFWGVTVILRRWLEPVLTVWMPIAPLSSSLVPLAAAKHARVLSWEYLLPA